MTFNKIKKREQSVGVLILAICVSVSSIISCKKNNNNSENAMPTAVLSIDTTRGDIATVFHFDASLCTDKEDPTTALQVGWNFGDGVSTFSSYTNTKTITHTYTNTGVYTAKLIVKDTQGLVDTASQMIVVVNNPANRPPNKPVYISPDNYSTGIPDSVKLKWLCTDPENDPLTYDVFLGYNANILYLKTSNTTLNEYNVRSLEKKTNYFWQIAVHDPNMNYVLGDVWKFTTKP
jgi:hypothetical protein